jgi:hypothetical protein
MIKVDEEDKKENCKKDHNRETRDLKKDNLSKETMKVEGAYITFENM